MAVSFCTRAISSPVLHKGKRRGKDKERRSKRTQTPHSRLPSHYSFSSAPPLVPELPRTPLSNGANLDEDEERHRSEETEEGERLEGLFLCHFVHQLVVRVKTGRRGEGGTNEKRTTKQPPTMRSKNRNSRRKSSHQPPAPSLFRYVPQH
jgi:hypothetical protein